MARYVLNPTYAQMDFSEMEMTLAGHMDAINMIEVGAAELPEKVVTDGVAFGHRAIVEICEMIAELQEKAGKPKDWTPPPPTDELKVELRGKYADELREGQACRGQARPQRGGGRGVSRGPRQRTAPRMPQTEPEWDWNTVRDLIDEV